MLATESRGAIVAIVVVLVALPLVAGHWWRPALALSLTALAVALTSIAIPGSLTALAVALTSIAIPGSPIVGAFQSRGLGTSGRSDLWTIASRMIEANPIAGVGVGNFRRTSAQYLLRPGVMSRSQYILDTPLVAHNSFLQVAAETGIVGLGLFIGIIAVSVASAWAAARRFEQARDHGLELIARALILAIIAILTTLVFLSYTDYGRPLWILLALGPALLAIAKSRGPRAPQSLVYADGAAP